MPDNEEMFCDLSELTSVVLNRVYRVSASGLLSSGPDHPLQAS